MFTIKSPKMNIFNLRNARNLRDFLLNLRQIFFAWRRLKKNLRNLPHIRNRAPANYRQNQNRNNLVKLMKPGKTNQNRGQKTHNPAKQIFEQMNKNRSIEDVFRAVNSPSRNQINNDSQNRNNRQPWNIHKRMLVRKCDFIINPANHLRNADQQNDRIQNRAKNHKSSKTVGILRIWLFSRNFVKNQLSQKQQNVAKIVKCVGENYLRIENISTNQLTTKNAKFKKIAIFKFLPLLMWWL